MILFNDTNLIIALAILFFILFLSSGFKEKSILFLSIFFGGMLFDHWIADNELKDTNLGTAWSIFYCTIMVVFIIVMTRDTIQNTKYIREKIKRHKALK
ncbi:hypothetical protein [Bacillus sp. NPDC094106]|uniref:hypothetical protein n=1 Tax=Bacillus sp. NPDC094106 TaxID=3363949 RepID=UPI0037FA4708